MQIRATSRLLVWRSTVWASASFGPLVWKQQASSGARKLQAWFSRQLRAIIHQPAHVTKVRTMDLLTKFHIVPPLKQVADRAETCLADLRALSTQQPFSILIRPEVLDEAYAIHADLREVSHSVSEELDAATQLLRKSSPVAIKYFAPLKPTDSMLPPSILSQSSHFVNLIDCSTLRRGCRYAGCVVKALQPGITCSSMLKTVSVTGTQHLPVTPRHPLCQICQLGSLPA